MTCGGLSMVCGWVWSSGRIQRRPHLRRLSPVLRSVYGGDPLAGAAVLGTIRRNPFCRDNGPQPAPGGRVLFSVSLAPLVTGGGAVVLPLRPPLRCSPITPCLSPSS